MIGYNCCDVEEAGYHAPPPDPYPTWTYRRGEAWSEESPFAGQDREVHLKPRIGRKGGRNALVDDHIPSDGHADPGRILGHPSRVVAPNLISGNQPQTFDAPHYVIAWAPNPIVQRTYGQQTLAVDDIRHTVPKQMPGYSYNALSQQEIADAAALQVRAAMYGR